MQARLDANDAPRARLMPRLPARLGWGVLLVVILTFATLAGPALSPFDPLEPDYAARYVSASAEHWLGTDGLGRDVMTRALAGGRVSVLIAGVATLLAMAAGGLMGLLAAYFGTAVDTALVRVFDALLAFPGFLLVLLVVAALGGGSPQTIMALGIAGSPLYFRLVRGFTRSALQAEHVTSARAIGAGLPRVLGIHVLPQFLGSVLVQAASTMATFLLVEASLSYLGLGVPLPTPSWGNVLQDARSLLLRQPWAAVGPGVLLAAATLGLQLLADGARDLLDRRYA